MRSHQIAARADQSPSRGASAQRQCTSARARPLPAALGAADATSVIANPCRCAAEPASDATRDAATARRGDCETAPAGGGEEHEQRRRSPMHVHGSLADAPRPPGARPRVRRVHPCCAHRETQARAARFETPLHGRRCVCCQRSLRAAPVPRQRHLRSRGRARKQLTAPGRRAGAAAKSTSGAGEAAMDAHGGLADAARRVIAWVRLLFGPFRSRY